ncbi:MAG: hypothetical protein NT166_21280 [Candidatus Aminicenantes bacterium]|nr:hypothetical protein [Candidatus Aminicenantes bacterium]
MLKDIQIAAISIFSVKKIGKKRRQGFFSVKHSIKSGRKHFFLEKVRRDLEYSIFQHLKSLPTTLEVSFAADKCQPPGGMRFFVKLRVSDQNCSNVL